MRYNPFFQFDRDDNEDLEELVLFLAKICLLVGIILSSIVMGQAIFGDGSPPATPKFWQNFVTWLFFN